MPKATKSRGRRYRKQGQKAQPQGKKARSRQKLSPQQKIYVDKLRQLERIGAYHPERTAYQKKHHRPPKLTKSRRATINRKFSEFEEVLKGDLYIWVPFPTRSKRRRRQLAKQATKNRLLATDKGIAVPKRKGQRTRARFKKTKTGEHVLIVKRTKRGKRRARKVTEVVPIEPFRDTDDEIQRIKRDAEILLPLKPGESLRFRVELFAEGEGFSREIFGDLESLERYLNDRYDFSKHPDFGIEFFKSITVMKVTTEEAIKDRAEAYERRRKRRNALRAERRARKKERDARVAEIFGRIDRGEKL